MSFDSTLRAIKKEAEELGLPRSFVDDVQHLLDKLHMLYTAREKKNAKHRTG